MNSKLRLKKKKPAVAQSTVNMRGYRQPPQIREQPKVPLKEVTVSCELKFSLTLTGEESPEQVAALILGRFDQCAAERRALLVNKSEGPRRVQMMLERAPEGRSSVNLWQWPITVS